MTNYIGTKLSYYGRRYTVTEWEPETGHVGLKDSKGDESGTTITITHKDLGGRKDAYAITGTAANDMRQEYIDNLIKKIEGRSND